MNEVSYYPAYRGEECHDFFKRMAVWCLLGGIFHFIFETLFEVLNLYLKERVCLYIYLNLLQLWSEWCAFSLEAIKERNRMELWTKSRSSGNKHWSGGQWSCSVFLFFRCSAPQSCTLEAKGPLCIRRFKLYTSLSDLLSLPYAIQWRRNTDQWRSSEVIITYISTHASDVTCLYLKNRIFYHCWYRTPCQVKTKAVELNDS